MAAHGSPLEKAYLDLSGDHDALRDAAMAVVNSLPFCARCRDENRPARRATHMSLLRPDREIEPVCSAHACVGDLQVVDPNHLRRLMALLAVLPTPKEDR